MRAYSRLRGVSAEAVSKAVRTGRITANGDGSIDPARADAEWEANTRPRMNGHAGPEAVATLLRARSARETYMAQLARLEFEVQTGKLIPAAGVRQQAFETARRCRDLLLSIPERLGPMLSPEQRDALEAEIDRALDELSGASEPGRGSTPPRAR
jgi:phage terminase Nu1 subunit (DNA packaging protein)